MTPYWLPVACFVFAPAAAIMFFTAHMARDLWRILYVACHADRLREAANQRRLIALRRAEMERERIAEARLPQRVALAHEQFLAAVREGEVLGGGIERGLVQLAGVPAIDTALKTISLDYCAALDEPAETEEEGEYGEMWVMPDGTTAYGTATQTVPNTGREMRLRDCLRRLKRYHQERLEDEMKDRILSEIRSSPAYDDKLPLRDAENPGADHLKDLIRRAIAETRSGSAFEIIIERVSERIYQSAGSSGCNEHLHECSMAGACQHDPCQAWITQSDPEHLEVRQLRTGDSRRL